MKELGKIRFTQRSATGNDESGHTRVYIYTFASKDGIKYDAVRYTMNEEDLKLTGKVFGFIEITHPWIMAGSHDEIANSFVRACKRYIEENLLPGMYMSEADMLCYAVE